MRKNCCAMVACGLFSDCKYPFLEGGNRFCSECKVILHNLCVQAALNISENPDAWLCGITYCLTKRSKKMEQLLLWMLLGVVVRPV